MPTRRQFFEISAAAGAVVGLDLLPKFGAFSPNVAWAFYQSPTGLQKFIQPLRGVGPGGIPVAASDGIRTHGSTVARHYAQHIGEFQDTLHPGLGPTHLWGYNPVTPLGGGTQPQRHLGGIIVAQKGVPIQLTFTNHLPPKHILPVDTSANFAEAARKFGGTGYNATTTHLHGGLVPWTSDGGPFSWFTPAASGGKYGPSVHSSAGNIYKLLNPNLLPGQAEYYYPNNQSARLGWYHDHSLDITRLNAYSGIASAYIIRDQFELELCNRGLPSFIEVDVLGGQTPHELPIAIQDKIFVGSDIRTKDPTWMNVTGTKSQTVGSLWYPHVYEPDRWELHGAAPNPSIIPEMFGDTMLANGTVFPEAAVEAAVYRLRILNACQARFLNLQLYQDDGSPDGITLNANKVPTNARGPHFLVIGTEGGFLPRPVRVPSNRPFAVQLDGHGNPIPSTIQASLLTAPAERWDVLVDFRGLRGKKFILYTDAPAPFPGGDDRNDYFPGNKDNPTQTVPGFGPNTRQILRFKVVAPTGGDEGNPLNITPSTNLTPGLDPFIVPPGVSVQNGQLNLPPGVNVRPLALFEDFDTYGRLIQFLGTNVALPYMDPATETPTAGSTEVWQITNTTADTHPIHFHLVNVQILGRQPIGGPARNPQGDELGWKETVKMHPGEVTTVIMRFDLARVPFHVPSSPRTGGNEFVWHCHILEHEEHDMMRPLVVV